MGGWALWTRIGESRSGGGGGAIRFGSPATSSDAFGPGWGAQCRLRGPWGGRVDFDCRSGGARCSSWPASGVGWSRVCGPSRSLRPLVAVPSSSSSFSSRRRTRGTSLEPPCAVHTTSQHRERRRDTHQLARGQTQGNHLLAGLSISIRLPLSVSLLYSDDEEKDDGHGPDTRPSSGHANTTHTTNRNNKGGRGTHSRHPPLGRD